VQKFVPTLGCGFAAAGKRALIEPASPDGTGPSAKTLIQSSTLGVPPAACEKLKELNGGIWYRATSSPSAYNTLKTFTVALQFDTVTKYVKATALLDEPSFAAH